GNLARASRLTRSSAPSPNRASETGASIPAATSEAPSPCAGSAKTTSSPATAARQAIVVPMTPPPAMTTSAVTPTPFAGITRIRYDGRRRAASLSALAGSRVRTLFPTVHLISAARADWPTGRWSGIGLVVGWAGDQRSAGAAGGRAPLPVHRLAAIPGRPAGVPRRRPRRRGRHRAAAGEEPGGG